MTSSQARIDANKRNALLSTGPRSAAGKERSRANGLKHGLCATVVAVEDPEAVRRRAEEWSGVLQPGDPFRAWLVDEVAALSLRLERCRRLERGLRDRGALRAEVSWDDDRRLDAERIGARIARGPAEVVESLRRTPQGCEWLMTRWAMLARSADVRGEWTPDQARLASDLLGTPPEFRDGHAPGESLDFEGHLVEALDNCAAVARREIAALKERREAVLGLDELDRSLAEADLLDEANPELKRLQRYEAALHRRLRWCLSQIQDPAARPQPPADRPLPPAPPAQAPTPDPTPAGPPRLARRPEPPIDLDLDAYLGPDSGFDFRAMLAANLEQIRIESQEPLGPARDESQPPRT